MRSGSHRRSPGQRISGIVGAILTMVLVGACTTPGNTPGNQRQGPVAEDGPGLIIKAPRTHTERARFGLKLILIGKLELGKTVAERGLARTDLSASERAEYLYTMAAYYEQRRDFDRALNFYARAAKTSPLVAPRALAIRSFHLSKLRRYREALADANRCLQLTGTHPIPANALCYMSQSYALIAIERYAGSERAVKLAIRGGLAGRFDAWRMLGMAQLMQKKFRTAERSFSRALLINPQDRMARVGLQAAIRRYVLKRSAHR